MAEYLIQKKTLDELAGAVRSKFDWDEDILALFATPEQFNPGSLPEGMTGIGGDVFRYCKSLDITIIPEGVVKIDEYAFRGCVSLKNITLPKSLKIISGSAFNGCDNLTTVTFKGTPDTIAYSAFINCRNLTEINVPWSEGEVADAPWWADNATINYGYLEEGASI